MKRHRRDIVPLTQINLTSLLDVAFVLLIAFMIVAPTLKYGLDLDLPTMKEGAPQLAQDEQRLFTIRIPKPAPRKQEFYLNDTPSNLADIEQRLRLQKAHDSAAAVEILADKDVPYETFIQAVGAVRRAGIEAVGLPVEPPQSVQPPDPAKAKTP